MRTKGYSRLEAVATTFSSPIDKEEVGNCQSKLFTIVEFNVVST